MRIIYLHQYFSTPEMPGGTRSYEMARRFVSAGHEVHMITSNRSGKIYGGWYLTNEAGIKVHWLPVPYGNTMPYHSRIKAFSKFAINAGIYSSRIAADVIFATSTPLTIAVPAVYASKRQRVPMVFEVRDLWPKVPIAIGALKGFQIPPAKWLERFAYKNSSDVVALSYDMKEGVIRTGYPSERVHVIPNSCDLDLFQVLPDAGVSFRKRFQWLGDRALVIYAGAIGRVNGISYLVRLAAKIRLLSPEVRFLVVGSGYEYDLVSKLARDLGVLNLNFFMLSMLPKSAMPELFSAATITTSTVIDLPQLWSNSANKFFDSLAAGRPIAINHEGWQAKILRETGAGLVLPANDVSEAARLLLNAISNKDWLAKASKAALSLARTRFNRDFLAKQLENVLVKAASSRQQ